MTFEAKYNDFELELQDKLFHVAPIKYLEKIRKNGLVPYSKSFEFKYEPRVYLFNKCDKNLMLLYGREKARSCNDIGFCVFKVLKTKLFGDQIYKDGKQKFYLDPMFADAIKLDSKAIFTYENIPRRLLEDDFLKVEIDETGKFIESVE